MNDYMKFGRLVAVDTSKLSTSTLKSSMSHFKILEANGIVIDAKTFTNGSNKLIELLKNKKGEPLSDSYKQQIAFTIKRMFPVSDVNYKLFKQSKHNRKILNNVDAVKIKESIDYAANQIKLAITGQPISLQLIEVSQVILLTICTSLRISEILQLTFNHLELIAKKEAIPIQSKGSLKPRIILNTTLMNQVSYICKILGPIKLELAKNQIHKITYARLNGDFIIGSSISFLRQELKTIASFINYQNLGFNMYRKYITSILINGGGESIAQMLNNHADVNTTIQNYDIQSGEAIDDTFSILNEFISVN